MIFLDTGYIILLTLSFPLWIRFLIKKKYRRLIRYRFFPPPLDPEPSCIWIHAVSVGEVKSLKYLIDQLLHTGNRIVLSVTTPSGYEYARKAHHRIEVINAPLDFSFTIRRFLKALNPRLLILNELEIWPNWLSIMQKNRIPTVVVNGRMSESAFRKYRRWRWLIKKYFQMIDLFFIQSEVHRERFLTFDLPESKITVCGNIKADEAFNLTRSLPSRTEILKHLKLEPFTKRTVVLASTHAADEKMILPALPALQNSYNFIVVPRHPNRAVQIGKQLDKLGMPHTAWSRNEWVNPDTIVLIVDRIGYLFHILAIADLVFMGGTFQTKIGGHNLYEPAIHGKVILGGPCYNNFSDIGAELVRKGAYRVIRDGPEFKTSVEELEGLDLKEIGRQALETVNEKRGSIECILNRLQSFITD
jgi:3-deoxy-D-manno-octulosonic-acid transferase